MNSVLAVDASKVLEDNWLNTSFGAGDVVTHGVETGLGWVDLDDVLKLGLAALQLIFPELALGFAIFNHLFFWVLALLQHLFHVA